MQWRHHTRVVPLLPLLQLLLLLLLLPLRRRRGRPGLRSKIGGIGLCGARPISWG
jgi:hypothetical protein